MERARARTPARHTSRRGSPPTSREQVTAAVEGLAGAERIRFFSMPTVEISSSMVRERVAAGRPIRHLIPEQVADRIETARLYRQGVTA